MTDLPITNNEIEQSNISPINRRNLQSNAWVKAQLVQDLAIAEVSQTELAEKYGVTQGAISSFKKRNIELIEARREKMLDDYGTLWIAQKFDRLATRQTEIENLMSQKISARNSEVIDKLLNSVAAELGDIPNKSTMDVNTNVKYEIVGINLDDLT